MKDDDADNIAAERRAHGRKVLARINELNRRALARAPSQDRARRSDDDLQSLYAKAMAEKQR